MRTVPAPLQTHLDQPDTTTTRLIKITLTNGTVYGITSLDRDVVYDDGEYSGEITYVASNGFDPAALQAEVGTSVDNTEAYALISDDIPGITVEQAEAGDLDDAQWVCYLVNYEDTSMSMGHVILDAGDLGEVRTRYGMIWIQELLSYVSRLKQPIGHVWSTTCRAIFGSAANTQTGCGIDVTPLWVSGEVTAVAAETNRTFTGDDITATGGVFPVPGRVQWLTGDNAGREFAVEEITGSDVSLIETTGYPIQIGDTYRIRPDCRKRYTQDCIGVWNNGPNFKGEPLIPVGDSSQSQTPGAQLPGLGAFVSQGSQEP
jgi:uncharacterized phage protein (TIGR02218 family)